MKSTPDSVQNNDVTNLVLESLALIKRQYPGRAIELRIPPLGAIQCFSGVTHTRGNPPNLFQTDPETWLQLISGQKSFQQLSPKIEYSGNLINRLIAIFPLQDFYTSSRI
jgi:hypothetical protein